MTITETNTVEGSIGFTDSVTPRDILSMIRCGILHHISTTVSTGYIMRSFVPAKADFKLIDDGSVVDSPIKRQWISTTWYEDIVF